MGIYFNDKVQEAFEDVFTCWDKERILRGQLKLKALADADNPDADACILLAKTFAGPQFVWGGAGIAEDNVLCYHYLQKGLLLGSPIGMVQILRIPEVLTPALGMEECKLHTEEAFEIVLKAAREGDAYCQYVIGNVFYWDDYKFIGDNVLAVLEKRAKGNVVSKFVRRLFHKKEKEYEILAKQEAIYWLEKSLSNGFNLFPGNLRNLYLDLGEFAKARAVAERSAAAGNPEMMYWAGIYAEKEDKDFEKALGWYEKGSALDDPYALEEAGDMYFWGKGNIPMDGPKAMTFYERGAYMGNTYCAVQCAYAYACGLHGVVQDWGRAGDWVEQVARRISDEHHSDILPLLGYMLCHGLGLRQDIELGVQALLKAEQEDANRIAAGRWEYLPETRDLWMRGLAYVYKQGFVDGNIDFKKVMFYTKLAEKNECVLSPQLSPDYPRKFNDLEKLIPKEWPYNRLIVAVKHPTEDYYYHTTNYDWQLIENAIKSGQCYFYLNMVYPVSDVLSDLRAIRFYKNRENKIAISMLGHIIINNERLDVQYIKTFSEESALHLAKTFYESADLPNLNTWKKQYWEIPGYYPSYILEVDHVEYVVDDYEDIDKNILIVLQGIQEGKYKALFMHLPNLRTGGIFIYSYDKKPRTFLVHILTLGPVAESSEEFRREAHAEDWKLYETLTDNFMEVHMWLQNFRMADELPDCEGYKEIPLGEDGMYHPLK